MRDTVIELSVSEAQQVLAAVTDRQLDMSRLAAISLRSDDYAGGDEHEIADLSAKLLGQVSTRIVDALYPDDGPCIHVTEPQPVDLRREDLLDEIEFGLV